MEALELLNAGKLPEAIDAAIQFVKQNPTEVGGREIFVELLCLSGDLERADKQAETILVQETQPNVGVALLRQLVRAELSRQECWKQGRVPEFLKEPNETEKSRLEAVVNLRQEDMTRTKELLEAVAESRPAVSGTCDDKPFSDFCDMDDFFAGAIELLTSTGKYYWVPAERVQDMVFAPVKRPRDLLWRQCEMSVEDGPTGVVYVPATYPATADVDDINMRLGRATDWNEIAPSIFQGIGQRMFNFDDQEVGIMDIEKVVFSRPNEE